TVRQVLDDAARRIDAGEIAGQPEVEASLRSTIGETYLSLGHHAEAQQHLYLACAILAELGEQSRDELVRTTNLRDKALAGQADFAAAERLHRAALAEAKKAYAPEDACIGGIRHDLGVCLRKAGRLAEAEEALSSALAQREKSADSDPLPLA